MNEIHIFNEIQRKKANFILNNKYAKLSELISKEIQALAVVWSFYSGRIEGNTYSYVDTESLLIDGITSEKKFSDAKMLKNMYNTFITIVGQIKNGHKLDIDKRTIFAAHSKLTDDLVPNRDKGVFRNRGVRISGTEYIPPKTQEEIETKFNQIIIDQNKYSNPIERAIFLHCNIARLQPFIDGNKRTSRLIESIVLMNNNIIPVYSSNDEDIRKYRNSIVNFYENQDFSLYADYFLNRQIQRINKISLEKEEKFDLENNREIKAQIKKLK